jgi:hypothetical protein
VLRLRFCSKTNEAKMANVKDLALSAARKLADGNALNEADAISKAIRGTGITHPADHKRLMSEVGRAFARNKYADSRRSSRYA